VDNLWALFTHWIIDKISTGRHLIINRFPWRQVPDWMMKTVAARVFPRRYYHDGKKILNLVLGNRVGTV
jgi:hypothetical protein